MTEDEIVRIAREIVAAYERFLEAESEGDEEDDAWRSLALHIREMQEELDSR